MAEARVHVQVAGIAGQVAAATVGVLPLSALPLTAAGLLVLSRWQHPWLRHGATAVALIGALLVLPTLGSPSGLADHKASLGLLLVLAQLAQAASWRTVRDERAGLLTAFGLLVLAASYSPDVLVGAPILVGWIAGLMALARLSGSRGPRVPVAASTAVVLGLVVFLLIPLPKQAGLHSRLAGSIGSSAPAGQRASEGVGVWSGGRLDLTLRGPLSDAPVLAVPAGSPSLWRSAVFDTYDSSGWRRDLPTGSAQGTSFAVSAGSGPTSTYIATPAQVDLGDVYAPGQLVSLSTRIPVAAERTPDGDVRTYPVTPYSVTVQDPPTSAAALERTSGVDTTEPRWTALPPSVPVRVRALGAQLAVGTTSRWQTAQAITAYLHQSVRYTLDSPVPAPGEDAVDRVLFVDHVGFCEQFASAEVVLLRSVGIPARLATGLAYGDEHGPTRTYRAKHLHAWVELWVPGTGWVTSDPTAGSQVVATSAVGLRARVSATVTRWLRQLTHLPGGRPLIALLLLGAVALAVLALRRRPSPARTPSAPRAGPALAAFLRLDERLGVRRRRPQESLRELGARLDPGLTHALVVVEQEVYGRVPPDPALAVEVLDRA